MSATDEYAKDLMLNVANSKDLCDVTLVSGIDNQK